MASRDRKGLICYKLVQQSVNSTWPFFCLDKATWGLIYNLFSQKEPESESEEVIPGEIREN
jgi:hypothetical protein